MTLLVKDANTTTQPLSTGLDSSGNLVPVHAPAAIVAGIATPVSAAAPLPVINAAGPLASDGSGTVVAGGTAQAVFGGIVPVNGWLVANNSSADCTFAMSAPRPRGAPRSRSRRVPCLPLRRDTSPPAR